MDDRTAIEKCRAGDHDAFRHLVELYQTEALGHATAILRNREDALDAVQEAFIDAFRALGTLDLTRRFYPWFYVILRHRCYKQAAKRGKREVTSSDEMPNIGSDIKHFTRRHPAPGGGNAPTVG